MSDFLMIVPSDYIEVPDAATVIGQGGGMEQMNAMLISGDFTDMNNWDGIRDTAFFPQGYTVTDARVFDSENGIRLWIAVAPE